MKASDLLVKCLEEENVTHIFGVPGEENEDLLFSLENSSIEFVPTRHEQGAAFIADVIGRLSGKAGVCLSTLGPGATNLLTGIADAHLDKSPIVAITGQGSLTRMHHESHQMIDVVSMLSPITKWNESIKHVETIPEIVRKAFKLAEQEKPGATHIELPEDIAAMEVNELKSLKINKVRRPSPDQKSIDQVCTLISKSEKPIILAGNGAIRNRASTSLLTLSEKCNIPVCSTFMGKGAISDRHPNSLFAVGLGFRDIVIDAFEESDLVICVGYDIAEYDPINWNVGIDKDIVHIDFASAEVYNDYNPEVEVVADIAESIQAITNGLTHTKTRWWTDIRDDISQSIESYTLGEETTTFTAPGVINEVRRYLPDDGLVISDVGSHKMWIARNFRTYCPNGCIISNGLASMGIAMPGIIGAHIVNPDRPTVAIVGDGGALMNFQELETAHRLGVKGVIIVLNDNDYGLIRWKQERSENKSFGTQLGNPNFKQLAESFGIEAHYPKTNKEFKALFSKAIKSDDLTLLQIDIDTSVNKTLT